MNTTHPRIMGYYMIKYDSDDHRLQEDTTCDGKFSTAGELVVKSQYIICVITKKKCYCEKNGSNKE